MTVKGNTVQQVRQHTLPGDAFRQAIFGSISSGQMEFTVDCNAAMSGLTRTTTGAANVPQKSNPWGTLFTVSSRGAGEDGRRVISPHLQEGEMVYQMHYGTNGALHTRSGLWLTGYGDWIRRW